MQRVGAMSRVVCRMNSDKCRLHRPMQGTPAIPRGDDVLRDSQFGCTGGSQAGDGGASGSTHMKKTEDPPGRPQRTQTCEVSP